MSLSIGFTGTRKGMTDQQKQSFRELLKELARDDFRFEFHHGCCLGADAKATDIADRMYYSSTIIAHPSDLKGMTSELALNWSQVHHPAKPPLDRNKDIVNASDMMIACPENAEEQLRSGTWATVRYCRKVGKPLAIVLPGGEVVKERWKT